MAKINYIHKINCCIYKYLIRSTNLLLSHAQHKSCSIKFVLLLSSALLSLKSRQFKLASLLSWQIVLLGLQPWQQLLLLLSISQGWKNIVQRVRVSYYMAECFTDPCGILKHVSYTWKLWFLRSLKFDHFWRNLWFTVIWYISNHIIKCTVELFAPLKSWSPRTEFTVGNKRSFTLMTRVFSNLLLLYEKKLKAQLHQKVHFSCKLTSCCELCHCFV